MEDVALVAGAGLGAIAVAEGLVWAIVHGLRRGCPWLITARDLDPVIDRAGLERFFAHGWDAELGWIRKPGTAHNETGKGGQATRYHIGDDGARRNPGYEDRAPAALACGDSYTFCRQVNDDQTWPHLLSRLVDGNVANLGVGNYGLDQALLRLERDYDRHPAPVVLIGIVPETISRVLAVWKHFSEYGNVFAFKPRFRLDAGGALELLANPAAERDAFLHIARMMPALQRDDFFHARKFTPDLLRFPYLYHLWRSRRRNVPLIVAALADRLGGDGKQAFCRVMERNIALAAALYQEAEPVALMVAITRRLAEFVRAQGAEPVLVMLPQLYDIRRLRSGDHYYAPFLAGARESLRVVDMGPDFAADPDDGGNYIDDDYGGHLTDEGNRKVAARLKHDIFAAMPAAQAGLGR